MSELTYITIIGTRYPELDTIQNDIIQFGNYLQGEQSTRGGFLPVFWDAPDSYIHASTDIGEVVDWIRSKFSVTKEGNKNLAVLHNRNKMVNAFATTEWVAGSDGAVLSRSVTSCAGMTAYLVLLAQTKVGFLSGGRGRTFRQLTPQEQSAQKEEAFARATVALTRAQQICMIMGPLDMRGLVGAATIMGCLKFGACCSGLDANDQPLLQLLLKDEDLLQAPDDSAFLHSLRISCSRVNGVYPPLALAEAFLTDDDHTPRVRRLHLIIVDLKRRRRLATRVSRQLLRVKVIECAAQCWNTLPVHVSMICLPARCDMSLPMQWMALVCLAIFSGLSGQRIIPSGVLMRGKVIGFNWTDVASWPLLELNNFSMPSVWTQDDPGGQPHVRRWVSRQATLQRILISTLIHSHPEMHTCWAMDNCRKKQG